MALNLRKAKELCNKSEWELVEASKRDAISTLNETQLKRHVARARKLRDKWRDQAVTQRRKTQQAQNARTTSANARSAEKTEIFDEVLSRFEKRLAKVAGSADSSATPTPKKTPPRRVRADEHRATRSTVRKKLASKRAKLDEKSVLESSGASPASAAGETPVSPTLKKKVKKVAKKGTKKASPASKRAAKKRVSAKSAKLDRASQRSAKTAAKGARLDKSGVNTRTRGHVSARGKRSQARRDRR
jgi:hypothetical protein